MIRCLSGLSKFCMWVWRGLMLFSVQFQILNVLQTRQFIYAVFVQLLQERKEAGKRGRKPGRKAAADKVDMKAKLGEYSRTFTLDNKLKIFFYQQKEAVRALVNVELVRSYAINTWKNL